MGANPNSTASGSHSTNSISSTNGRLFGLLVLLAIVLLVVLSLFAGGSRRLTHAPSSPLVTPEEQSTQAAVRPSAGAHAVTATPTPAPTPTLVATEETSVAAPTSTPLPVEPDRKTGLTLVGSVLFGLLLVIGIVIWRR